MHARDGHISSALIDISDCACGKIICLAYIGKRYQYVPDYILIKSVVYVLILDFCTPNPCQNGGSCTNTLPANSGFLCSCPDGWFGKQCQNKGWLHKSSRQNLYNNFHAYYLFTTFHINIIFSLFVLRRL